MTIRLLAPYGLFANAATVDLDNATEAALVSQGRAVYTVNPGATFQPLTPALQQAVVDKAAFVEGMKAGLLVAGDSLGGQNSNEQQILTLSRSGIYGTVTASSLVAPVGSRIKIGNVTSDPRWNGFFVVDTAWTGGARFIVPADLDAAPTTTRTQMNVTVVPQRTASGDYVMAEMTSGKNFTFVDNVAVGARTLEQIDADFEQFEGKYQNLLVDLNGGTNDARNGVATAVSSAALESYIRKCMGRGHIVLLNTVPPLYGAANTAAVQQTTLSLNAEVKRLAIKYGLPLYDKYAALVDPATAALLVANVDTSDNVHLTPTACRINGIAKALIYAAYVPSRRISLPATTSDTIGQITTSSNILDGFFAGTGGSGGAGSIATGWTLTPTTITVTGSKGVGSVGATQILTLSGASGSWTFVGPTVVANLVVGATYELVGKVSLANFAAGLRMTMGLATTINGFNGDTVRAISVRNATTPLPIADADYIFRSEPFTVTTAVTLMQPRMTCVTTGVPGGTETVTCEAFAINRLS
jgi:hypothetical protein